MKYPHPHSSSMLCRCLRSGRLLTLAPIFALMVQAQTVPSATGQTIVLSPFTITSEKDVGYEASESLAGTGLRTKLTDLGASVSVITSKFLKDTGSKNLGDLLVYQTNMEVRGFGGNYSGVTPSGGGFASEPSLERFK